MAHMFGCHYRDQSNGGQSLFTWTHSPRLCSCDGPCSTGIMAGNQGHHWTGHWKGMVLRFWQGHSVYTWWFADHRKENEGDHQSEGQGFLWCLGSWTGLGILSWEQWTVQGRTRGSHSRRSGNQDVLAWWLAGSVSWSSPCPYGPTSGWCLQVNQYCRSLLAGRQQKQDAATDIRNCLQESQGPEGLSDIPWRGKEKRPPQIGQRNEIVPFSGWSTWNGFLASGRMDHLQGNEVLHVTKADWIRLSGSQHTCSTGSCTVGKIGSLGKVSWSYVPGWYR